jgi:hypothetical protein
MKNLVHKSKPRYFHRNSAKYEKKLNNKSDSRKEMLEASSFAIIILNQPHNTHDKTQKRSLES